MLLIVVLNIALMTKERRVKDYLVTKISNPMPVRKFAPTIRPDFNASFLDLGRYSDLLEDGHYERLYNITYICFVLLERYGDRNHFKALTNSSTNLAIIIPFRDTSEVG